MAYKGRKKDLAFAVAGIKPYFSKGRGAANERLICLLRYMHAEVMLKMRYEHRVNVFGMNLALIFELQE